MKKRFLSALMALVMLLSLLPTTTLASDPVPDGETVPYMVTVKTPDLGGKVVTAQFYTTTDNGTHVPELDVQLVCNGDTYEIPSGNGDTYRETQDGPWLPKVGNGLNSKYWKANGGSEQADVLFVTDDPTISINEQWCWITADKTLDFSNLAIKMV